MNSKKDYEYEASGDYEYENQYETSLEEQLQGFKDPITEDQALDALFGESLGADLLPDTVQMSMKEEIFDSELCHETLTAMQGEISTPGFKKQRPQYPSNLHCQWEIVAPPNHHIELDFVKFKLEYHRNCRMDRVEIHHDGHGFFLCGHGVPGREFVSEGPAMKVILPIQ